MLINHFNNGGSQLPMTWTDPFNWANDLAHAGNEINTIIQQDPEIQRQLSVRKIQRVYRGRSAADLRSKGFTNTTTGAVSIIDPSTRQTLIPELLPLKTRYDIKKVQLSQMQQIKNLLCNGSEPNFLFDGEPNALECVPVDEENWQINNRTDAQLRDLYMLLPEEWGQKHIAEHYIHRLTQAEDEIMEAEAQAATEAAASALATQALAIASQVEAEAAEAAMTGEQRSIIVANQTGMEATRAQLTDIRAANARARAQAYEHIQRLRNERERAQ